MAIALQQRTVARVLFDERHGESWSISRQLADEPAAARPAAV